MYFYNTDKIVLALQDDLYSDQYNKNQTGWLITLYKMGPGQTGYVALCQFSLFLH